MTAVDNSETEEADTYKAINITSHSEAETVLSKCTEWFEIKEEADAMQVLLSRKIRNLASQKTQAVLKQKTTDFFKN